MDVAVYLDAHLGIGRQAHALEQAGFTHLWVFDSPLVFADPYMALLEAARATERLTIGPGVTHPGARPAYATAQALATLAVAAPGRVAFGIGTGNSARWSLGLRPATLDELFDHVRVVDGLLAGEEVDHREDPAEPARPLRLLNPRGRWIDLSRPIETWISAFGPVGQRRAGAVADGVIVRWQGPEALAAARERVAAGARAAGRDPAAVRIAVLYAVYPLADERELESDEAVAALGPHVISRLRYLTANHASATEVPPELRAGFDAYRRHRERLPERTRHLDGYEGYLVSVPESLRSFVTPESIRSVVHVDDAAGVARELRRMADAGVDQAGFQITGPPAVWCERMGAEVLPAVRTVGEIDNGSPATGPTAAERGRDSAP
jgi:alkanesulfonate monooxygenase SsuD/methylene tetrahydromethanopterin reductase-like flavin-dependent oxidoreductase (luciferase family)